MAVSLTHSLIFYFIVPVRTPDNRHIARSYVSIRFDDVCASPVLRDARVAEGSPRPKGRTRNHNRAIRYCT